MIRLVRSSTLVLLSTMVGLAVSSPRVEAGPNANAKILLHLLSPTSKNACTRAEALPACSEIVTNGDLYPATYFAYVLVTDADSAAGVAGLQFGIDYTGDNGVGVDVFDWTLCATLQFPTETWPAPGSGNLITWDSFNHCQRIEPNGSGTGVTAIAGYFYCTAYSPDSLEITTRPSDALAKIASCAGTESVLPSHALGSAVFSTGANLHGNNPCGAALDTILQGTVWSMNMVSGSPFLEHNQFDDNTLQLKAGTEPEVFPIQLGVPLYQAQVESGQADRRFTSSQSILPIAPDGTIQGAATQIDKSLAVLFKTGEIISSHGRRPVQFSQLSTIRPAIDASETEVLLAESGSQLAFARRGEGEWLLFSNGTEVNLPVTTNTSLESASLSTETLAIAEVADSQVAKIKVFNRDGNAIFTSQELPGSPKQLKQIANDRYILYTNGDRTLAIDVLTGTTVELPLPPGRHYYSSDLSTLAIFQSTLGQDSVRVTVGHLVDISNPLSPIVVVTHTTSGLRVYAAVSYSGRFWALQTNAMLQLHSRDSGLLLERPYATGDVPYGLDFVGDRYLLEGCDLESPGAFVRFTSTRRMTLYDCEAIPTEND